MQKMILVALLCSLPMLSGVLPRSGSCAADYPAVTVGGWIGAQYYWDRSEGVGSVSNELVLKSARVHAKSKLNDSVSGIIQFEVNTGTPGIAVAYLTLAHFPYTSINVGFLKTSFGIDIYQHPLTNPTINASYAAGQIWPGADMGIQITHERRWWFTTVSLQNGRPFKFTDDNSAKSYCGKLIAKPLQDLGVGGSYYDGTLTADELSTRRYAGQVEYKRVPWWVRCELYGARDETAVAGPTVNRSGYYVAAAYRLLRNIEAVARYEGYDPDTDADGRERTGATLGLSYYLTSTGWDRVSVNYELREEEGNEDLGDLLSVQIQMLF